MRDCSSPSAHDDAPPHTRLLVDFVDLKRDVGRFDQLGQDPIRRCPKHHFSGVHPAGDRKDQRSVGGIPGHPSSAPCGKQVFALPCGERMEPARCALGGGHELSMAENFTSRRGEGPDREIEEALRRPPRCLKQRARNPYLSVSSVGRIHGELARIFCAEPTADPPDPPRFSRRSMKVERLPEH